MAENIKDIVNNTEWQALRIDLIGTWKKTPEESLSKLKKYGGDLKDKDKVRRLLNYLTGSGFRSGNIVGENISSYREKVREAWKQLKD